MSLQRDHDMLVTTETSSWFISTMTTFLNCFYILEKSQGWRDTISILTLSSFIESLTSLIYNYYYNNNSFTWLRTPYLWWTMLCSSSLYEFLQTSTRYRCIWLNTDMISFTKPIHLEHWDKENLIQSTHLKKTEALSYEQSRSQISQDPPKKN